MTVWIAAPVLAAVIIAQPLVNENVLEPSVCNEVEHAIARAPSDAPATALSPCETNGLDGTQIAIRLVSSQRSDGRWMLGTNDVTSAAVALLKGLIGADDPSAVRAAPLPSAPPCGASGRSGRPRSQTSP